MQNEAKAESTGVSPEKRATVVIAADRGVPTGRRPAAPPRAPAPPETGSSFAPFDPVAMAAEITRRRRRRLLGVMGRVSACVLAPFAATVLWFTQVATPLYNSEAQFVIQQADATPQPQLGGMLGAAAGMGGANSQDAVMIQAFLTSRDALDMLDRDHGFTAHFTDGGIDWFNRLDPGAPREKVFDLYEKMVRVGYDPTEGVLKLEVIAADPAMAQTFAAALIGYAEARIDSLTERMRAHQMADATLGYQEAERQLRLAQDRVITLQQDHAVLSAEAETGILSGRAGELEKALTEARLSLASIERNAAPHPARLQVARDRVSDLEGELALVRQSVNAPTASGGTLAGIQGEIALAQGEVEARLQILGQAAQQMEQARIEAGRQMRFVSVSVTPGLTDVAAYPELAKNAGLAFLLFLGLYLAGSLTGTVLREQVNS